MSFRILIVSCLIGLGAVLPSVAETRTNVTATARAASDAALQAVKDTSLSLDIVFRAVDNAVAGRDKAEREFIASMKGIGAEVNTGRLRKALVVSNRGVADALELAGDVSELLCETRENAAVAAAAADEAAQAQTLKEAEASAKRAVSYLKRAAKSTAQAAKVREEVKRRWLTPVLDPIL